MTTASGFSWASLSDSQFEQLVFEIVASERPISVTWRKGPGDKGRDIEAKFRHPDPFGTAIETRVFVEAKHYEAGVSPTDIAGALAWAAAEQPDSFVLAVSSHLTTSCREHIDAWHRNNPRIRVQVWERREIENRTIRVSSARQFAVQAGLLPASMLALLPDDPTALRSAPKVHGLEMEYRYWLTDEEADHLAYAADTLERIAEIVVQREGATEHFDLVCLSASNHARFLRILQAQIRLAVTTRDVLLAQIEGASEEELKPILARLEERVRAVREIGDSSVHVD